MIGGKLYSSSHLNRAQTLRQTLGAPTPGKLAQTVQKVPLFIRIPGIQARPIDAPVSATQIAQTVIELALKGQRSNETPLNSLLRFLKNVGRGTATNSH